MTKEVFKDVDKNNDGEINFRDLKGQTKEQSWKAPVEDERGNIRELKRLRAADALQERKLKLEEAKNDLILAEQEREHKLTNRGTLGRVADVGGRIVHNLAQHQRAPTAQPLGRVPRVITESQPVGRKTARSTRKAQVRYVYRDAPQLPRVDPSVSFSNAIMGISASGLSQQLPKVTSPKKPRPTSKGKSQLASFSNSLLPRVGRKPKSPIFKLI